MRRFANFMKNLRFEFKVLWLFIIIALLYVTWSIVKREFFQDGGFEISSSSIGSGGSALGNAGSHSGDAPSSISDAVSADRPLIISENNDTGGEFQSIMSEYQDIKYMELSAQVANPVVWIYVNNDRLPKDDVAAEYCLALHGKGIAALKVEVYDERERLKGRLIRLGEHKCM